MLPDAWHPDLARGGELIKEVACSGPNCQFPQFPGTVSWKIGYQLYRDEPVRWDGKEFTRQELSWIHRDRAHDDDDEDDDGDCDEWWGCWLRFDRNRDGIFHYLLYGHARGVPKSTDKTQKEFHVPRSVSGVSDLPGGGGMVTLGLWDNFIGTDFAVASTTMHELGHQFDLWHGGAIPAYSGSGKNLLVSFVQLGQSADPDASPALLAALRRQAVQDTAPINFREIVNYRELKKLFAVSAIAVLLFGGYSFNFPEFMNRLLFLMFLA